MELYFYLGRYGFALICCLGVSFKCLIVEAAALKLNSTVDFSKGNLITSSNLLITSFAYNPSSRISLWIRRMFGDISIHRIRHEKNKPQFYRDVMLSVNPSIFDRNKHPLCSVELLGFVLLDSNFNSPLYSIDSKLLSTVEGPLIGTVELSFTNINSKTSGRIAEKNNSIITCYYRSLYLKWSKKRHPLFTAPNYNSIFFYCPSYDNQVCDVLSDDINRVANFKDGLVRNNIGELKQFKRCFYLNGSCNAVKEIDKVTFVVGDYGRDKKHLYRSTSSINNVIESNIVPEISNTILKPANLPEKLTYGICLILAYRSNGTQQAAVDAKLVEWLRYYTRLNIFQLFVYDFNGDYYNAIFGDSTYKSKQNISSIDLTRNLIYQPYSIQSLLNQHIIIKKNIVDSDKIRRVFDLQTPDTKLYFHVSKTDSDKIMSSTHCRFEANTYYNIDKTLIVDGDEFLYCPVDVIQRNPRLARITSAYTKPINFKPLTGN